MAHGAEVREHLGALLSLMRVRANKALITLLMEFWEPNTMTFKFLDFEITLTLEEVSDFAELLLRGKLPVLPSPVRKLHFLGLLGLDIFSSLRNVEDGKLKLDYLFRRYNRLESYDEYRNEFVCTYFWMTIEKDRIRYV